MLTKKTTIQFVLLTILITFVTSGLILIASQYGFRVYNWVTTPKEFLSNMIFAVYISSPAIASYYVSKKNGLVKDFKSWMKAIFYFKCNPTIYLYMIGGLALYFGLHIIISKTTSLTLPLYTILLSLPGSLFIGGLEEAGWSYILQPYLCSRFGYIKAALITFFIWTLWHIPLFFIPGTNHGEGNINFIMFIIQLLSFRFLYGTFISISGKGSVFMCIVFHTLFNAVSPVFGTMTMTWIGTIIVNVLLLVYALVGLQVFSKRV